MSIFNINELTESYTIITIHGTREAYIQNFISITELGESTIRIRSQKEILCFKGKNLLIEYMNQDELKVTGLIESVQIMEVLH